MGKSTISMIIFNIFLYVYQRVYSTFIHDLSMVVGYGYVPWLVYPMNIALLTIINHWYVPKNIPLAMFMGYTIGYTSIIMLNVHPGLINRGLLIRGVLLQ